MFDILFRLRHFIVHNNRKFCFNLWILSKAQNFNNEDIEHRIFCINALFIYFGNMYCCWCCWCCYCFCWNTCTRYHQVVTTLEMACENDLISLILFYFSCLLCILFFGFRSSLLLLYFFLYTVALLLQLHRCFVHFVCDSSINQA